MDKQLREAYSEIYYILSVAPSEYQSKISDKFKRNIDERRDKKYNVNIDMTKPLNTQNLKPETKAMLAMMYYNYWSENDQEKKELSKMFIDNEKKFQKQQEDVFFNNKQKMEVKTQVQPVKQEQVQQQEQDDVIQNISELPTVYKDTWYIKFKNFFKRLFKKGDN